METDPNAAAKNGTDLRIPVILGLRTAFLLAIVVALLVLALRHGGEDPDRRMPSGIPTAQRLGLPERPGDAAGGRDAPPSHTPEGGATDLAAHPSDSSDPSDPAAAGRTPDSIARPADRPLSPHDPSRTTDTPARDPALQPVETQPDRPQEGEPATDAPDRPDVQTRGDDSRAHEDTQASDTPADREAEATEPESIDWSQYEITGPVPRANIVIYIKGRVILLRSHADRVRIYRRIGAPEDASAPKHEAGDKRAPIGQYRITRREKTADGFRLYLNYPALQDAKQAKGAGRIDQETFDRIAAAARAHKHPPQDTPLGGGICIAGAPESARTTEKRFLLRPGEIEELWRATRLGTPVTLVP